MAEVNENIREQLRYEAVTGKFYWKNSSRRGWTGKEAGCICSPGRSVIRINNRGYYRSNLVWFFETGEWPEVDVDHEDRNKLNDVFSNLRLATRSQNCMNKEVQSNNTSGMRGIHQIESGAWMVQVRKGSPKTRVRKSFKDLQEAIEYRDKMVKEIHGDFSGVYDKC